MSDTEQKLAEGVEYTRPTSQLDLEARLENDNKVAAAFQTVQPGDAGSLGEDDAFVGVDPIYQNYANDYEKPLESGEGPEREAEKQFLDSVEGKPGKETDETRTVADNAAVIRREDQLPSEKAGESGKTEAPAKSEKAEGTTTPPTANTTKTTKDDKGAAQK